MDSTLLDIKNRLSVDEVLGGYIQLKKAGASFKALCPFHNEKTSSLIVSPQKQIWHCFGCGEGGDIFGFVMRFENVEFKDALKILAQKAGVELSQYKPQNPKEQEEKDILLRINDFASRLFQQTLFSNTGKEALQYLENRGLTIPTIQKWQIGFAPEDFHFLHNALLKKNIKEELIIKSGVCLRGDKGNIYDRFRGRITFPVFNYFGEIAGFSARILPKYEDQKSAALNHSPPVGGSGTGQAKYINSPETPVYNKSQILFGLNFAKDAIRKKDEMVIVEGQMDCISLHQAGFENVVASSGTAYNERAVGFTTARRLSKNIKLCFDSDSAGQIAMRKAGELLLKLGFRIKVIILRAVKDPDELVKKSPNLWAKAVSEAVWFLDYFIELAKEKFKDDLVEQKHFLSEQVVPLLGFIQDLLEQDHYINELVKKFNITEKTIRAQIKNKTSGGMDIKQAEGLQIDRNLLVLEKEVLGGLLAEKDFKDKIRANLLEDDFETFEIKKIIAQILQDQISTESVNSSLAKEAVFMVESLEQELGKAALLKRLNKSYSQLKVNSLKKKQKFLQNEIARAEAAKDKELLQKLQRDFAQVIKLRMEYDKV